MNHREITIYDIAKKLDISATTVSRALQNHPAVNAKTKKSIVDLANELGYQSNKFASNLRKQKTHTIGVIVPRLNSVFMSTVLSGIEKVANNSGYNLIINQSFETQEKEAKNAQTMFNNRVDALIISLAYDTKDYKHLNNFIKKKIPSGKIPLVVPSFALGLQTEERRYPLEWFGKKILSGSGRSQTNAKSLG